jgi:hypothetical protein
MRASYDCCSVFGALEDFKIIIYVDCSETVVCVAGVRNLILFIS